ncbi:hypothetical protein C7M61_001779 [Candidozyma pseudohaemuli]|uniref:Uncharacterized protein n=1 Tax=Candidozyma pseudohaemuli TaxID=418784 RepID=A0A2P7YVG9_9ASCO|nr:hypothetical protein C7M61_001779 [[Candida] pseudohaemulonii]PSK39968.1 hypothetical protein C7M61_001779 [[Candida] pseudohaemulonii]
MLYLAILALLGTPALGEEARTYEYSDDRLFTVVFSGSNVQHIATTKTTITGDTSTRERTFLTYTGEGARPTGEASLNDTDESDPELDAEDLYSSDDDGIFIAMHEDEEAVTEEASGSASSEASSEASASDSGTLASALGSDTSASGSGSETSGESETSATSGSETSASGTSGSATSGTTSGTSGTDSGSSDSETSGNNGAALSNGLGTFFAAAVLALL